VYEMNSPPYIVNHVHSIYSPFLVKPAQAISCPTTGCAGGPSILKAALSPCAAASRRSATSARAGTSCDGVMYWSSRSRRIPKALDSSANSSSSISGGPHTQDTRMGAEVRRPYLRAIMGYCRVCGAYREGSASGYGAYPSPPVSKLCFGLPELPHPLHTVQTRLRRRPGFQPGIGYPPIHLTRAL
jgi:hypothetical protein